MRWATCACLLVAGVAPASPPNHEDAPLRAITFVDAKEGWAVGDEGVVWHTIDGGTNWDRQPTGTRASLRAVQFLTPYTGFVVGRTELPNRAGSVGVLLSTIDGGVTWTEVTTSLLPGLNAVQFFDDKSGIVAGDTSEVFPTGVFRTADGGRSWAMRPAAERPADPARTAAVGDTTFEVGMFGRIAGRTGGELRPRRGAGERAAVLFAFRRSSDVPFGAVAALAADGYLCAASADDADDRLSAAVRAAGGVGANQAGVVEAARFWMPDVIVTDRSAPDLPAAKVYSPAAGPGDGVVTLNLTAYVPELGGSPRDAAEPAALLLGPTPQPDALHFRLVGGTLPDGESHTSLMQGIHLGEGGTARRKKPAPAPADREAVAAVRRELEAALAAPPTIEGVAAAVAKLRTLPEADAARAGTMLGFRLAHAGHATAARELFGCVAGQYAAYPDAVEAVRWLTRFHTSGEVRRRVELGHFPNFAPSLFVEEPADRVQQAGHTAGLVPRPAWRFKDGDALRAWVRPAAELQPKLAAFGTAYSRDPATAFCLATAHRGTGLPARAADAFKGLVGTTAEPWAGRMGDELRRANVPGDFPKVEEMVCRFTRAKPFLDGKLDDPCWKSAAGPVRMLCDDEFLYVAAEGKGPTGEKAPRDADPVGRPRLELLLDVDRDYTTAYRLAVDAAGSVFDECWGDAGWNPKLYVATTKTADGWAVEVAIPLAELTGERPTPSRPWAAGAAVRAAGDATPPTIVPLRFAQ